MLTDHGLADRVVVIVDSHVVGLWRRQRGLPGHGDEWISCCTVTARQTARGIRRHLGRLPRPRWWRVDDSTARLADLERRLKAVEQRAQSLSSSKESMRALVAALIEAAVDTGASVENLVATSEG